MVYQSMMILDILENDLEIPERFWHRATIPSPIYKKEEGQLPHQRY
jgi:hypothetical protein